jgi:hypothetical protein
VHAIGQDRPAQRVQPARVRSTARTPTCACARSAGPAHRPSGQHAAQSAAAPATPRQRQPMSASLAAPGGRTRPLAASRRRPPMPGPAPAARRRGGRLRPSPPRRSASRRIPSGHWRVRRADVEKALREDQERDGS